MQKLMKVFERVIISGLIGMMMLAVFVATIELGIILFHELMKPPMLLLDIKKMQEVFGFFLMVLIGLELLESIKAYLREGTVHAEVVFLVAIVAISRKVIIVDYKEITAEMLYGMSAVILALGIGYYCVRRALHSYPRSAITDEPQQPTK
ncbi:MAG: phosphate-starvation-inducible E-like protein [Verrucomicrobia bacterium]|nr:phosphate-starvation-inducible E-like protein [Verrucomicrobiota bacterium]